MAHSQQPLVTIAIPTFNRADSYFRLTFESALKQTYPNLEIIVSDNGSTDSTPELVERLRDERVTYFRHQPSIHYNDNFNFCVDKAKGEYFQLLHDDDLIDEDFVSTCVGALSESNETFGILRSGLRTIDDSGHVLREYPNMDENLGDDDFILRWLNGQSMLILCSILFHRDSLKRIGGFSTPRSLFQDVMAEITLAKTCGRLDIEPVKASFRKHSLQSTNCNRVSDWIFDSKYLLEAICRLHIGDAETVKQLGLVHFTKHNYEIASGVSQRVSRYRSYWDTYRSFEFVLAPHSYFLNYAQRNIRTKLGRIRRMFFGAPGDPRPNESMENPLATTGSRPSNRRDLE